MIYLKKEYFLLFVLIAVGLSINSCKKEDLIEENPSNNEVVIPKNVWLQTQGSPLHIYALEKFNDTLFLGGNFGASSPAGCFFSKYTVSSGFQPVIETAVNSGIVYDLEIYNGKIHAAGQFQFVDQTFISEDIMSYSTNGVAEDLFFNTSGSIGIFAVKEFQGDLIVGGGFYPSGNGTKYIDRLQNGYSVGLADLQGKIQGITVHESELFAVGIDDGLQKWNGSSWDIIDYNGSGLLDKVWSVASYNSELYLFGQFYYNGSNYAMKKMNSLGQWTYVTDITYSSNPIPGFQPTYRGGLKIVDGELYAFCRHFTMNGIPVSGVVKFDGTNWISFGDPILWSNIETIICDVTIFNNVLYIGGHNMGLWEYHF